MSQGLQANGQLVEARNVSMYPEDWAVVHQVAKDAGQSISGGLRIIIRDWVALKEQQIKTAQA